MGRKVKTGKGRLDKYYKLAKERGYRSRSAFKLIQLNKQFKFLDKVKCLVDLCAAPGGWLQVASAFMPRPRLIIGVDLVPIKPIKDVVTFEGDITSQDCKKRLKSELNGTKADIILHDGSPNMGASWSLDAFNQSDLVLNSLQLATESLLPGGWFITKIFRSNDYNKLLWILNKLFFKVVSTKPASSRNESAEVYMVCQGFKSPKSLDRRFLDPKYAFKEIKEPTANTETNKKENMFFGISNIYHPDKKRRHRSGYSDNETILYHEVNALDFISKDNYLNILAGANCLTFGENETQVLNLPTTTDEIKVLCGDLKVLGRSDFKLLIKWRKTVRMNLGLDALPEKEANDAEQQEAEKPDSYEEASKELKKLQSRKRRTEIRERERKVRAIIKQQGGYDPLSRSEIYDSLNKEMEGENFDIPLMISNDQHLGDETDEDLNSDTLEDHNSSGNDQEPYENQTRLTELESELDHMYEQYVHNKNRKHAVLRTELSKEGASDVYNFYEEEEFQNTKENEDSDDNSSLDIPKNKNAISSKIAPFISGDSICDSNDENLMNQERDEYSSFNVKATDSKEDPVDEKAALTPELITLAKQLATEAGRKKLIDGSYNRYSHGNLSTLPVWLRDDILENHRVNIPVTREAAAQARKRAEAIDARPIRKVAEALLRRQARVSRAVKKASKTLEELDQDNDASYSQKSLLTQAKKMVDKSKIGPKKKTKVIVARGRFKNIKGRPRGVKGRYKLVDARMRKDSRVKNASKRKSNRKS